MADFEESGKAERLAAAQAALRRRKAGESAALCRDLFESVEERDILAFTADEIAVLAEAAMEALRTRPAGKHRIHAAALASVVGSPATVLAIVNDNMAFLVDSVLGELIAAGREIRLLVHPILAVRRSGRGRLAEYRGISRSRDDAGRESLIMVVLPPMPAEERRELIGRLDSLLGEVRLAVGDWQPMMAAVREAMAAYTSAPPPIDPDETAEAVALLNWLIDRNFTFLGVRRYDFSGGAARGKLTARDGSGLGILADPKVRVLRRGKMLASTTPEIRHFLMQPEPLIVTKANVRSRVHRRSYMDYIGIKLFSPQGKLTGELRIVGLFTSTAYHSSIGDIPYLRRKAEWVMARSGYDRDSHSGKSLYNILESYPRDELFQIDRDTLLGFTRQMLRLEERPRPRVLARRDRFDRFLSILVFVPRDHYNTQVRIRIGDYLARAFGGHVSHFEPAFLEGSLTRVHFIIGRDTEARPDPPQAELEANVAEIVRTWNDRFHEALCRRYGDRAAKLFSSYARALPDAYREDYSPETAVEDIGRFEALGHDAPTSAEFYRNPGTAASAVELKLVHLGPPIELTRRVPILENFGFRVVAENTYRVDRVPGAPIHIHDMSLETADGRAFDSAAAPRLLAAMEPLRDRLAESDGYDALIIHTDLGWREVALLRTLSRFLRQAGVGFSQQYMAATLVKHSALAAAIVRLFAARLAPPSGDPGAEAAAEAEIEAGLNAVAILDEDRIVRHFAALVRATLRTNYFQRDADGNPKPEISLKLDSRAIPELPQPRPFREIYLYSPRLEAVHLRFGKTARGGIRWSDRPEDFRTEILGLVKAQQVKNAVIVPVGAKGGFVPKSEAEPTPEGRAAAGRAAYRVFMETLLDLTDNIAGGRIVPPADTVRRDDDDPYLVVAADKGTASFSDLANAVAEERGFWLDDAFASGGSAGYDHKAMGITARGAFEAVKRHFREMDVDIRTTSFTAVGVGDMSGDVFGNGMLLLPTTRLVAAFDHRDIFLDPDPDPAVGIEERRRLFDRPRSSWQDYDRALISPGGGVFSRSLKSIPLSPEIRAALAFEQARATPAELIRAILRAPVDLLWFGGIGTYVRAEEDDDGEIGDRANDSLRVTAEEVRAKVIGEGANLAVTERGRIAYCLAGGRCNSDAIDNSAGVNTSDVEVNLKIALAEPLRSGRLKRSARNRLLAGMTDEVAALVLRNNYLQTLAITLTALRGPEDHPYQQRMMQALEARGELDRRVEDLPADDEMRERLARRQPLTRPEIAILLAYAKLSLSAELLAAGIASDPALDPIYRAYFPGRIAASFTAEIDRHRLRPEITVTQLTNLIVNRGGPTFATRVGDRTGAGAREMARAFLIAGAAFRLEALNDAVDALDSVVRSNVQLALYQAIREFLIRVTVWFVRNTDAAAPVHGLAAQFRKATETYEKTRLQSSADDPAVGAWIGAGVPPALAQHVADLPRIASALDIEVIASASGCRWETAAEVHRAIGEHFRIARLEALAHRIEPGDYYDGLALDRALRRLAEARRAIALAVMAKAGGRRPAFDAWLAGRSAARRVEDAMRAVAETGTLTPSRVAVAADLLTELAS